MFTAKTHVYQETPLISGLVYHSVLFSEEMITGRDDHLLTCNIAGHSRSIPLCATGVLEGMLVQIGLQLTVALCCGWSAVGSLRSCCPVQSVPYLLLEQPSRNKQHRAGCRNCCIRWLSCVSNLHKEEGNRWAAQFLPSPRPEAEARAAPAALDSQRHKSYFLCIYIRTLKPQVSSCSQHATLA